MPFSLTERQYHLRVDFLFVEPEARVSGPLPIAGRGE
jgi:hypothetical protein